MEIFTTFSHEMNILQSYTTPATSNINFKLYHCHRLMGLSLSVLSSLKERKVFLLKMSILFLNILLSQLHIGVVSPYLVSWYLY